MMNRSRIRAISLLILFAPLTLRADPLHPIAEGAYWHHESNCIFPAALAGFARVGAPQEVDGSTTVVAHYARGEGAARIVAVITVFPVGDVAAASAGEDDGAFVRTVEHAGWRIVVRAPAVDAVIASHVDALVRGLRVERLGEIDTRCPNAGCGS
jgi:hypothetical protein